MTSNQIIVFIVITILIIIFSWFVSLREKRYHGIPRFFVFEGLLYLGLVQSKVWFVDPGSILQVFSWIFLSLSIGYVIGAFRLYFRHTKPDMNFENTAELIVTGLYKYIRHPMYASLLFLGWGMYLKDISFISTGLILITSLAVYITCKIEEKEMILKFGIEYQQYKKNTKLFLPWII